MTRHRTEYVDGGNGYHVGTGTWKVVRGTGQYAQIAGGGRSGTVWLDRRPLELPQRRLPDPSVSWAEPDGAVREGARRSVGRGRTSEMTTNRIHSSSPRPSGNGGAGRYLRGRVPAGPRRWVKRASPGRACGARTPYRGQECDRLRFRRDERAQPGSPREVADRGSYRARGTTSATRALCWFA